MSIHWVIDSRSRLVVVTAEGKVTRADFEEYLEVVTGAGANGYAKIFDGTRGENAMTREDMLALAARFRECMRGHTVLSRLSSSQTGKLV